MFVQEGHFQKIEVYFLIVGHTHASIDQFFSVLAGIILLCEFIGSPLALEALLMNQELVANCFTGNSSSAKVAPLRMRKITVVYHMKSALKNIINKEIKYYPIPHRFVFEKFQNVSAMQYSVYSGQPLLPPRPANLPDVSLDIAVPHFGMVGGQNEFVAECGANGDGGPMDILSRKYKHFARVSVL